MSAVDARNLREQYPDAFKVHDMCDPKQRVKSFQGVGWPKNHPCPKKMSEAGFFFAGTQEYPDNVKCPFCLKEMCCWEPTDDPWEDHKRTKTCPLVKLGKKFTDKITVEEYIRLECVAKQNATRLIMDIVEDNVKNTIDHFGIDWTTMKKKNKKMRKE